MPSFTPDKFEAGTPNIAGIYGLLGSLENYPEPAHSNKDILELMDQISRIEKVRYSDPEMLSYRALCFPSLTSSIAAAHNNRTLLGIWYRGAIRVTLRSSGTQNSRYFSLRNSPVRALPYPYDRGFPVSLRSSKRRLQMRLLALFRSTREGIGAEACRAEGISCKSIPVPGDLL